MKLPKLFFGRSELQLIADKLDAMTIQHIACCSFESRFARSGGLASVITNLLPYIREINEIASVLLMTPFYPGIINLARLKNSGIRFTVPFDNKTIEVDIYEYRWRYEIPRKGCVREFYLSAEGFFETSSTTDPYVYDDVDRRLNNEALSYNALFFCKAVPLAMKALEMQQNIMFHLHEWQTALIALTSKEALLNGTLESCGCALTIHNSYDCSVTRKDLKKLMDRSRRNKLSHIPHEGFSAYEIGIQMLDVPITTVSEHFTKELTSDIMFTKHFTPHLQYIFRHASLYGINNGIFIDYAPEFPRRDKHTKNEIKRIKLGLRHKLIRMLTSHKPQGSFGELTYRGGSIAHLPDNIPIVVMSGRLDFLQKGYCVLLSVIEKFAPDEVKFILTPLPTKKSDLDYFYETACKCMGNVSVFPFRMRKGYHLIQTGSTFGLMPSIYEPFGAALEYMVNGTVTVARATGGLLNQIDPECGFLYREEQRFLTADNIRSFVESVDIPQLRKTNPLIQNMADHLYDILTQAIHIYKYEPERYYRFIINGFKKSRKFSWETAAKKYFDIFNMIGKGKEAAWMLK